MHGAALGVYGGLVPGAVAFALLRVADALIPFWAIMLVGVLAALITLPAVTRALARLLLRYEYVGHAI